MKIILVSHQGYASGMLSAAKFIIGDLPKIDYLELDNRGIAAFRQEFKKILQGILPSEKVILLSDIPSGSPGNTAFELLMDNNLDVTYLSGCNLPMILDLILTKNFESALKSGRDGLINLTSVSEKDNESEDF